jgi:hypothetical protein
VTFTPKFNAKFGRGIPKRILKLIERDQVGALAEANKNEDGTDGPVLAPFKQFNKARPADPVLPAVSVYKRRVRDINQAEGQRVESTPEWAIEVAVEAQTEDAAIETLEIYVEAVDSILRADPNAILADVDDDVKGLVELEITAHEYGRPVADGQRYVAAAAITLQAKMMEV